VESFRSLLEVGEVLLIVGETDSLLTNQKIVKLIEFPLIRDLGLHLVLDLLLPLGGHFVGLLLICLTKEFFLSFGQVDLEV
jgi:hypothetical protein